MGYSGAWGTLIYEKNLMSKISCQTPFNIEKRERGTGGEVNNAEVREGVGR